MIQTLGACHLNTGEARQTQPWQCETLKMPHHDSAKTLQNGYQNGCSMSAFWIEGSFERHFRNFGLNRKCFQRACSSVCFQSYFAPQNSCGIPWFRACIWMFTNLARASQFLLRVCRGANKVDRCYYLQYVVLSSICGWPIPTSCNSWLAGYHTNKSRITVKAR